MSKGFFRFVICRRPSISDLGTWVQRRSYYLWFHDLFIYFQNTCDPYLELDGANFLSSRNLTKFLPQENKMIDFSFPTHDIYIYIYISPINRKRGANESLKNGKNTIFPSHLR